MTKELQKLLVLARNVKMTPKERDEQRVSFAYGNSKIENNDITRRMVEDAAAKLKAKAKKHASGSR